MLGDSFQRKLKIVKNGGTAPLDVSHFIFLASFTISNEMFPLFSLNIHGTQYSFKVKFSIFTPLVSSLVSEMRLLLVRIIFNPILMEFIVGTVCV